MVARSDKPGETIDLWPDGGGPVRRQGVDEDALIVDVAGFEGPLDLLLQLARSQKVDISRISILALAEQYLGFIEHARRLRMELAADYLVMAAWLAYLKSRLLLPEPPQEDEPGAPEMIEALSFQLRRLEAMRSLGERLMARPRLGRDVFLRGAPEGVEVIRTPVYRLSLFELLKAYGDQRRRTQQGVLHIAPTQIHSMQEALLRLRRIVGRVPHWQSLFAFLPADAGRGLVGRSAVAATFAAGLELAREGLVELRQPRAFGPIYLRSGGGGR